jgi:hypothetical protein
LSALYDGACKPVFAEDLPPLIVREEQHHVVTYDGWQRGTWEGGGTDLILQLSDDASPLPRHYLDHLKACLISGGVIVVQGDDLVAVVDAVETINAAAEVRQ